MVTFLLPRSHTLEITDCPKHLTIDRSEKEPLRVTFSRTSSKSPERGQQRTDPEEKVSRSKSTHRSSWFKSITSSLSGGGTPRSEPAPSPLLDDPTHVRRRSRSMTDPKAFTLEEDPRLPDHMKRPELQLRRIQRRDLPSRSLSTSPSSVEQTQKYPLWWAA